MNSNNFHVQGYYIYDKYLYIHEMIQGIQHGLSSVGKQGKEKYKSSMCEMVYTKSVIHVDITSRMFYCYNNFKKYPHGTSLVKDKIGFENVVNTIGNNYQKDALSIICSSDIINTDHNSIKVCYPGSLPIYLFENLNINHEYIFFPYK